MRASARVAGLKESSAKHHAMTVRGIRSAVTQAKQDGKVTEAEVDALVLKARDGKGLTAAERQELLRAASTFDDAGQQRVLRHLSAMGQTNAWVNLGVGTVANIEGRYADTTVAAPGLSAKVGLFDSSFALKGKATADGSVTMTVEGRALTVKVTKGDTAAQVLEKLKAKLPREVSGVLLARDVQPYDTATFTGAAARAGDEAAQLMLFKPKALELQPGEVPLKVVVTGYGAFMGITDNPSSNMAQKLAEAGVRGAVVEYRRLEVTPAAVDAFIAEMKKAPPDVILSMGVTGGQSQVEERPENHLGAAEDGNGAQMEAREVRAGGAEELKTDLPVEAIDWALQAFGEQRQVFTSKSDANYAPDRSAYLCNYLGYNLATEFGGVDSTTAGFMHITSTTPVDQMHAALEAITARQLDVRRGQTPARS